MTVGVAETVDTTGLIVVDMTVEEAVVVEEVGVVVVVTEVVVEGVPGVEGQQW